MRIDSDCCSAAAKYAVIWDNGWVIYLCGHHYNKHADYLTAQGYKVEELENAA